MIIDIDFSKSNGLLPAIIQDAQTKEVLMLGYMNQQAYEITLQTKKVTFFSRSRQKLWTKGESSKNYLLVEKVYLDCDKDTLIVLVEPTGVTCHLGHTSCFNAQTDSFLHTLERIINQRIQKNTKGSYTRDLYQKGINKVAQKLGEEAIELVIEAKDNNKELFLNEAADLMYHYLVLLKAKGFALQQVEDVLRKRNHHG
ncbi:bifunctional phosphoribosyl-AMP cyclohydrolase/phosphoribosyl-ATP diphosphatase HisIE [Myroides sp. LJL119]